MLQTNIKKRVLRNLKKNIKKKMDSDFSYFSKPLFSALIKTPPPGFVNHKPFVYQVYQRPVCYIYQLPVYSNFQHQGFQVYQPQWYQYSPPNSPRSEVSTQSSENTQVTEITQSDLSPTAEPFFKLEDSEDECIESQSKSGKQRYWKRKIRDFKK